MSFPLGDKFLSGQFPNIYRVVRLRNSVFPQCQFPPPPLYLTTSIFTILPLRARNWGASSSNVYFSPCLFVTHFSWHESFVLGILKTFSVNSFLMLSPLWAIQFLLFLQILFGNPKLHQKWRPLHRLWQIRRSILITCSNGKEHTKNLA